MSEERTDIAKIQVNEGTAGALTPHEPDLGHHDIKAEIMRRLNLPMEFGRKYRFSLKPGALAFFRRARGGPSLFTQGAAIEDEKELSRSPEQFDNDFLAIVVNISGGERSRIKAGLRKSIGRSGYCVTLQRSDGVKMTARADEWRVALNQTVVES